MGANIGEPCLDIRDAVGVGCGLRFRQQAGAFAVGGQHDVDQRFRRRRRLLGQAGDALGAPMDTLRVRPPVRP